MHLVLPCPVERLSYDKLGLNCQSEQAAVPFSDCRLSRNDQGYRVPHKMRN